MKPAWARSIPMSWLYRIILFLAWCYFKIFYRHRVYGLEHFEEGGGIIAANHTSFYDPPLVSISWPEEVHFLARGSLFFNRFFGLLIRKLNAHPVSGGSSDVAVFRLICSLLKEGKKVILFPEGMRSFSGELAPLKPGVTLLISRSGARVIPAYIHGAFKIWGRGRSFPKFWGKTACVFGRPIKWEDFAHLEKRQAQEALTEKLSDSIAALRKWYEAGAQGIPP